jgi:hypothetical protein
VQTGTCSFSFSRFKEYLHILFLTRKGCGAFLGFEQTIKRDNWAFWYPTGTQSMKVDIPFYLASSYGVILQLCFANLEKAQKEYRSSCRIMNMDRFTDRCES